MANISFQMIVHGEHFISDNCHNFNFMKSNKNQWILEFFILISQSVIAVSGSFAWPRVRNTQFPSWSWSVLDKSRRGSEIIVGDDFPIFDAIVHRWPVQHFASRKPQQNRSFFPRRFSPFLLRIVITAWSEREVSVLLSSTPFADVRAITSDIWKLKRWKLGSAFYRT